MTELLALALAAALAVGATGVNSQPQAQDGTATQSSEEEPPPPPDDDARIHIIDLG